MPPLKGTWWTGGCSWLPEKSQELPAQAPALPSPVTKTESAAVRFLASSQPRPSWLQITFLWNSLNALGACLSCPLSVACR